ncbi:MAG: CHAT domain-containing protein, partial [Cyanobacteria bacterium P01_H01_bin.121]
TIFQDILTRPETGDRYLRPAQRLYDWVIEPVEEFLVVAEIDTLLICAGAGLRTVPFAALHNGENFLVEDYAITTIPAFNLIESSWSELGNTSVLAMGASEFEAQSPLPAVPLELQTIHELTGQDPDRVLLNEEFTLDTLLARLTAQPSEILHLATHAHFQPGEPEESFIQLGDSRLSLDQMRDLPLQDLALLILSACTTAVGDEQAELGFAGLALNAGAQSALASLWQVSDAGTFALMDEFYRQLPIETTKAEALRQTQLEFLQGDVRVEEGQLLARGRGRSLPNSIPVTDGSILSHPYYWAGFTLISSPW